MIILLLLAFALVVLIEAPGLVKKKMWRELVVFSFLLAVGMALSIPQVFGIRPFDPNAPIKALFGPVGEWLKKP